MAERYPHRVLDELLDDGLEVLALDHGLDPPRRAKRGAHRERRQQLLCREDDLFGVHVGLLTLPASAPSGLGAGCFRLFSSATTP